MLISALLSITFAPALRDILIRGKIRSEKNHPVSRLIIALYEPFVYVALRRPKSTIAIGLFALASAVPIGAPAGHEFMPPLNEGDLLYMPITFPNISIEEAKRQLQYQDRMLRSFPEVATVFGKIGRAESADRSGADHDGRDDGAASSRRRRGASSTTIAGTPAGRPAG